MYVFTESLPYLLNRVGVRMGELFGRELADDGLTLAGYRVLAALAEMDDQRLIDLSAMTTIEMTTLSRLVAAMAGRKLIRRRRPKDNLRIVRIGLLAGGRALLAKYQSRATRYEQTALRGLGAKDVHAFKEALSSIYDALDDIEHEQAAIVDHANAGSARSASAIRRSSATSPAPSRAVP